MVKKSVEMKSDLDREVSFKLSDSEMEILNKKADALGMEIGDLVREYLLQTPMFDGSVFEEKKAKKISKVTDEK